jgi:hypothetical protein
MIVAIPMVTVVTQSAAQAITCPGGRTGIWEIVRERVDVVNGRTVQLTLRNERASDYSTAVLAGNLASSDEIWAEKINTATGAWEACPRTTVGIQGGPVRFSNYISYNKFQTMRACMSFVVYGPYRQTLCTGAYTDNG